MTVNATPGETCTLTLYFRDYSDGALVNGTSVQLDITAGGDISEVPDVPGGGPFTWQGASVPNTVSVAQTGVGTYQFLWEVPADLPPGVYVANWTIGYSNDEFPAVENIYVGGGSPGSPPQIPVPAGDLGYWTGGIIYPAQGLDIEFGQVDASGTAWLWQKITGWDSPDVQGGGVIPKSGDHGGWASPQYYAPRQITLTCAAMAPTQALRDVARQQLQQAVPISDLATLRYDEPTPKQALVRRSGKVTESCLDTCHVQWTIGLVAPDPRKYSTQTQVVTFNAAPSGGGGVTMPITFPMVLPPLSPGGSAAVTNAGNFETRPVITIVGPITSPALVNVTTNQSVSWSGLVVPAGQSLIADFSVMQATLGGAYRAADPFSSWWNLPPGTSTVAVQGQSSAGASVSVAWSSAYM